MIGADECGVKVRTSPSAMVGLAIDDILPLVVQIKAAGDGFHRSPRHSELGSRSKWLAGWVNDRLGIHGACVLVRVRALSFQSVWSSINFVVAVSYVTPVDFCAVFQGWVIAYGAGVMA